MARIKRQCSTDGCYRLACHVGSRCGRCWDMWQVLNGYPNGMCSAPSCESPVRNKRTGLCIGHHARARRYAAGMVSQGDPLRPIGEAQPCSVDGCTRRHDSHGYCQYHKRQIIFGFKPKKYRAEGAVCAISGCGKDQKQGDYCHGHYSLFWRYSITPDWWESTLRHQGGKCAICLNALSCEAREVHVDHDHSCCPGGRSCGSCVRGLLCRGCNWALGHFGDNVVTLRAAADYIEKFRAQAGVL